MGYIPSNLSNFLMAARHQWQLAVMGPKRDSNNGAHSCGTRHMSIRPSCRSRSSQVPPGLCKRLHTALFSVRADLKSECELLGFES